MKKTRQSYDIKNLTLLALMTALVVLLQLLSTYIKFGPFSITLSLIPIVIGGAMLGPWAGAFLGLVMAGVVLLTGGADFFIAYQPLAAILLTLVKSSLAGLVSGCVYRLFTKKNQLLAIVLAAALCPLVNTGTFLIGTFIFFLPLIATITPEGSNTITYIFVGMIGWNFVVELVTSMILIPVTDKVITVGKKMRHDKSYL